MACCCFGLAWALELIDILLFLWSLVSRQYLFMATYRVNTVGVEDGLNASLNPQLNPLQDMIQYFVSYINQTAKTLTVK